MRLKTWLRQNGWAVFLAVFVTGIVWIVSTPPHYSTYVLHQQTDRLLVLVLGLGHVLADALVAVHPLMLIVLAGVLYALFVMIRALWRAKRWPTLIFVAILLVSNWLFVGAFRFVLAPSIGSELLGCDEYIFDENTVLRIIRYPVDVNLEYGEQQFFLVSNDQGDTWRQVFQAYGIAPYFIGCENISRNGQDGIEVAFERKIATETNEWVIVESSDRGRTWQVNDDD